MQSIFKSFDDSTLALKNRIVMAPMTRSRAINNVPNSLMADYYSQRTGAGLIITEGTAPSPEALGYPRIPGIYTDEQIKGWQKITEKVHQKGSKIFLQLMHTGRIGHLDNLPNGVQLVGPSDIRAQGEVFTDTKGPQPQSTPKALTIESIKLVISDFVQSSKNAIQAGFDGVEVHGANGYLIEQFLNPHINNRKDEYGGSIENRSRIVVEIANAIASTIGKNKIGIRLSPFSTVQDIPYYDEKETINTYMYLAKEFNKISLVYIHLSLNPNIPQALLEGIRAQYHGIIIQSNGLDKVSAQTIIDSGRADLVAFGRKFLANPDLVNKLELDAELNEPNFNTFYTSGAVGYTDYPVLAN